MFEGQFTNYKLIHNIIVVQIIYAPKLKIAAWIQLKEVALNWTQMLTSSRTRVSSDSLMEVSWSNPADKQSLMHFGVVTKTSGGPANAARCK